MKKMISLWVDEEQLDGLKKRGCVSEILRNLIDVELKKPVTPLIRCRREKDLLILTELITAKCTMTPGQKQKEVTLFRNEGLSFAFERWSLVLRAAEGLEFCLKKQGIEMLVEDSEDMRSITFHFPDGVNGVELKNAVYSALNKNTQS